MKKIQVAFKTETIFTKKFKSLLKLKQCFFFRKIKNGFKNGTQNQF